MAGLFGGFGKAGTGLVGGLVQATGKVVETVGEAAEDLGEALSGKKQNNPKTVEGHNEEDQEDQEYQEDEDPMEFEEDDDYIDEAEKKLMSSKEGAAMAEESDDEDHEDEDGEEANLIPKHFSLKSKHNNRYLRYDENSDGLLRYSGKNVVGPYSKFAICGSKTNKGFVHIRCCYNNKFWVRSSEHSNYIAAVADEQEEDKSKWSCTLFEPIFVPDQNGYYFRHVQLNKFLCSADRDCLAAQVEDLTTIDDNLVVSFTIDWDSIFILPKYVAFKSNNGEYLEPSGKYLKFSTSNIEDPAVVFEIISMEDGYVRIKHVESDKYWIRDPNWIHCESINTQKDNPNTLFWPVKVDNNFVALRNKANSRFCKRLTTEGKTNCLNAAVLTITDTARFEVTEVVVARSIDDVEYRLNDARVYGKKILTVSKGTAINDTEVAEKVTLKFRYEKKVERSWSSSVSTTVGLAAKFTTKIPTVGKLKFELSFEVTSGKTWEETEKEKSFEEVTETVTVPPMSKVRFGGVITQASCDVPFSYIRRDTLKDGRQVTNKFEDGIFTGVTTFDYKFETEKLPL
ncbi:uncharacterized protein LOC111022577 [Momordica charantia]|uniref:Uncharacterized protein LOC111022577 n=1 Tax=Momordica charantia TaxID=3673 RepID=A0A6J1DQ91_MOMCH|nr:uncharacterized protein LOC111022577 [Momordica charantia]